MTFFHCRERRTAKLSKRVLCERQSEWSKKSAGDAVGMPMKFSVCPFDFYWCTNWCLAINVIHIETQISAYGADYGVRSNSFDSKHLSIASNRFPPTKKSNQLLVGIATTFYFITSVVSFDYEISKKWKKPKITFDSMSNKRGNAIRK